jgi:hypothetical protein
MKLKRSRKKGGETRLVGGEALFEKLPVDFQLKLALNFPNVAVLKWIESICRKTTLQQGRLKKKVELLGRLQTYMKTTGT